MAETPSKIKQELVGDLQLRIRGKNGTARLVNLGVVRIPYELDVSVDGVKVEEAEVEVR